MDRPAPAAKCSVNGENGGSTGAAAARSSGGTCGFCLSRVRAVIPQNHLDELLQLVRLAGPVVISQLMVFMVSVVSMVFCGHLGKTELAGVSLAAAVVNVTGISIGTGLSAACDTLMSQTYGSGNLKRVGVILQRGILILLLACFPCWAVLINTEPLLLAARQTPEVASLSQLYVKIFMPAVPAAFIYQLQGKYLQNQGIMWPQVITGAAANVLNALINYVFLFPLQWGVAGSAAANLISQYLLTLFLFAYIRCRGLHEATWAGWSLDCLQEWGPFIRLAVPSMLMICLSWWVFEIGGFLAGVISEVELGAQSIAYQLCVVAYMFPLGFSVAASVRVGNALGAGDTRQAKLSCKVAIIYVGVQSVLSVNDRPPYLRLFRDIIQRVADVMLIFGFMHVCDATAAVASGVLRGAAKQLVGALCNLVGFYFIGFPIGVSLMFAAHMGIVGLWMGLCICVSLQAIFFVTFLYKLDWKKAADEALVRAGVHVAEEKETLESEQTGDFAQDTNPEAQREFIGTTVGDVLSVSQLAVRRGLALLIMVSILAAGVLTSNLLLRLLK
uniref:Multidrug and toxin extrusion protein n=1 Tax=Stegastes partitus TaxID=144197 RepID=A0A3B4Z7R7_9TELE